VEVLVETGNPVEYGEELAIVAEPVDLTPAGPDAEAEA
jgi:hypothetical protein